MKGIITFLFFAIFISLSCDYSCSKVDPVLLDLILEDINRVLVVKISNHYLPDEEVNQAFRRVEILTSVEFVADDDYSFMLYELMLDKKVVIEKVKEWNNWISNNTHKINSCFVEDKFARYNKIMESHVPINEIRRKVILSTPIGTTNTQIEAIVQRHYANAFVKPYLY